jgi:hypothetical protein
MSARSDARVATSTAKAATNVASNLQLPLAAPDASCGGYQVLSTATARIPCYQAFDVAGRQSALQSISVELGPDPAECQCVGRMPCMGEPADAKKKRELS